jgi:hypothetical protein
MRGHRLSFALLLVSYRLCCVHFMCLARSVRVCREGIPWDVSLDDSRTFSNVHSPDTDYGNAQDSCSLTRRLSVWLAEEVDSNSLALE